MDTYQMTSQEVNQRVRRAFRARWYDVRLVENFNDEGETYPMLVTGYVKQYQRPALKHMRNRYQRHVTEACLNELCRLGQLDEGRYVIHLEKE